MGLNSQTRSKVNRLDVYFDGAAIELGFLPIEAAQVVVPQLPTIKQDAVSRSFFWSVLFSIGAKFWTQFQ